MSTVSQEKEVAHGGIGCFFCGGSVIGTCVECGRAICKDDSEIMKYLTTGRRKYALKCRECTKG